MITGVLNSYVYYSFVVSMTNVTIINLSLSLSVSLSHTLVWTWAGTVEAKVVQLSVHKDYFSQLFQNRIFLLHISLSWSPVQFTPTTATAQALKPRQ